MLRQSERYCLRHGREGTLQRLRVASLDGLPVFGHFPQVRKIVQARKRRLLAQSWAVSSVEERYV